MIPIDLFFKCSNAILPYFDGGRIIKNYWNSDPMFLTVSLNFVSTTGTRRKGWYFSIEKKTAKVKDFLFEQTHTYFEHLSLIPGMGI
jgi:hypothetical protein